MDMISKENYEALLVRYAEGELEAEERTEVEAFLQANAWAREELELFLGAPTMPPCAKEYGGAEGLKRRESVPMRFQWRWAVSAAACGLLALGIGMMLWHRPEQPIAEPKGALVAAAEEVPEAQPEAPPVRPRPSISRPASAEAAPSEATPRPEPPAPQPEPVPAVAPSAEPLPLVEQVGAEEYYSLLALMEPAETEEEWALEEPPTLPLAPEEPPLAQEPESLLARIEEQAQRLHGIWQHVKNIFSTSTEFLLAYNE